jgi:hypothetical protein
MADKPLSTEFNDNSPPPAMLEPEAYRLLLEKLLGEGTGWGKTEAVAAYFLHDMRFVNETPKGDEEQVIKVQPLYVVMDLKEWPNTYGRTLAIQEIASQYGRRMVGEEDMNAPDFKAPGIWTVKKNAFESDYLRRQGIDEYGKPLQLWDPNPDAYRLCLRVKAPVTIPTLWGAPWPVGVDGTVTVRERDVAGLVAALEDIRAGRATAEEALFTKTEDGKVAAKFDVYGMMPGFLGANYKPVPLKPSTQELTKPFETEKPSTMNVLRFKSGDAPQ